MHLIWVSESTLRSKKISFSVRHVFGLLALVCVMGVLAAVLLRLTGFQVLIQFAPSPTKCLRPDCTVQAKPAQDLDLVAKQAAQLDAYRSKIEKLQEQERLLTDFVTEQTTNSLLGRERDSVVSRQQLSDLQEQLITVTRQLNELTELKDKFIELATPAPLKSSLPDGSGRGGPFIPLTQSPLLTQSLTADLRQTLDWSNSVSKTIEELRFRWLSEYELLTRLPIAAPLSEGLGLNSNFGPRVDPLTGQLSKHSGIDFVAASGTAVYAAGAGTVLSSKWDGPYGQIIEIEHAQGYTSKYAHLRKSLVSAGQQVARGQKIAEVGATGRTTGPHLHFEVSYQGTQLNPMQVLVTPAPQNLAKR